VLEGNGESGLCVKPLVRHYGYVVGRGDGFKHRNSDGDVVFILCVSLAQDK